MQAINKLQKHTFTFYLYVAVRVWSVCVHDTSSLVNVCVRIDEGCAGGCGGWGHFPRSTWRSEVTWFDGIPLICGKMYTVLNVLICLLFILM